MSGHPPSADDLFSRGEVEKVLSSVLSPSEVEEAMKFIYDEAGGLSNVGISGVDIFAGLASLSEDAARRVRQYRVRSNPRD